MIINSVIVMGECMVEFSRKDSLSLSQSFAGDVYNTAIYLKRLMKNSLSVSMFTAVGDDDISGKMLSAFEKENIDISNIIKVKNKTVGAYLIETDDDGERCFTYWRDTSAAKFIMSSINSLKPPFDSEAGSLFYFSGISIAILSEQDRIAFWQMLGSLRQKNIKIVFDSNYRAKLWSAHQQAQEQFTKAFEYSDIVFAGVEDFSLLYGKSDFKTVADFLSPFNIDEVVIKNGGAGLACISQGQETSIAITPIKNVVDTTSAGDSFNGGYLAARLTGRSVSDASKFAIKIAGCVIQHKGAIVDAAVFDEFVASNQW